jgi:hypothetical protein
VVLSVETVGHFGRTDTFVRELGGVTRPGRIPGLSALDVLLGPAHVPTSITSLHHSEDHNVSSRGGALAGVLLTLTERERQRGAPPGNISGGTFAE